MSLTTEARADRARVDDNGSLARAFLNSLRPENHLLRHLRITDTYENSIRPLRDAYRVAPPALRYVALSPPSLLALNTRSTRRIEARFASKVCMSAGDGIYATHCNGPKCDRSEFVCGCPCLSCDLRRALYEQATVEIVGPRVALAHAPAHALSVHDRIVERWHFLQLACEADGSPALHCDGPDCQETEEHTLCECGCEGCGRAVGLLVQAERDVVGEPEAR